MADVIQPGVTKVTLSAIYSYSDGSTAPANDASWTLDNSAAASLSAALGASIDVLGIDLADGSLAVVNVTADGEGFSATVEVDVQMSTPPAPSVTGISITSSGPVPVQ